MEQRDPDRAVLRDPDRHPPVAAEPDLRRRVRLGLGRHQHPAVVHLQLPGAQYGRVWFTLGYPPRGRHVDGGGLPPRPSISARRMLINFAGLGGFIVAVAVLTPVTVSSKLDGVRHRRGRARCCDRPLVALTEPARDHDSVLGHAARRSPCSSWPSSGSSRSATTSSRAARSSTSPERSNSRPRTRLTVMILVIVSRSSSARRWPRSSRHRSSSGDDRLVGARPRIPDLPRACATPRSTGAMCSRSTFPIALAFGLGGGALLYFLAKPGNEEIARIVGHALLCHRR